MSGTDRLYLMDLFVKIVKLGSFKAAADALGLNQSKVTKDIQRLENGLGSVLLNRTTRSLGLTRAGQIYFDAATEILWDYERLSEDLNLSKDKVSGELRITAPSLWGDTVLTPLIVDFKSQHRSVVVHANYENRFIDLYKENYHIAFRTTVPETEPYLSQQICGDPTIICASPQYFEDRQVPTEPSELKGLDFISFGSGIHRYTRFNVRKNGNAEPVRLNGSLSFDSMLSVYTAVLSGCGVAAIPEYLAREKIRSGELLQLLPDYELPLVYLHAFYTERKSDSLLISKFLEFVRQNVEPAMLKAN